MAERERERTDGRAVALGVLRGAVAFGVTLGIAYGLGAVLAPVLRDLGGQLPIRPWGIRGSALPAAFVGIALGWAHLRGSRRVAGGERADYVRGASALERYRDRRSDEPGRGLAESRPVQRWDVRLAAGGPAVPDAESVTDA